LNANIGKWHQGFYTYDYTPLARGFDTSFGFLVGGEDHYTCVRFSPGCTCLLLHALGRVVGFHDSRMFRAGSADAGFVNVR
jgi:hypothetical protein